MYLMLGSDAASSEETWITDLYAAALKQATVGEQTRALDLLKRWKQSRSERKPFVCGFCCRSGSAKRASSLVALSEAAMRSTTGGLGSIR
jgi:hypothetical protein